MADFDLYAKSLCGGSLKEALNKFVDDGKITPDLAKKVLIQFEKVRREGGCFKAFRCYLLDAGIQFRYMFFDMGGIDDQLELSWQVLQLADLRVRANLWPHYCWI